MNARLSKQAKGGLWSRYFLIITAANLLIGICLQFYNSTTALYVQSLGGSATFSGLMLTMYTISATIIRVFVGRFLDKTGRIRIIVLGNFIYAFASLSFLVTWLPWLPIARAIQGIGYAMVSTGLSVAISDVVTKQRLSEGIGYYGLSTSLTSAVGPAIAMALCASGDYSPVFYAAFGCSITGAGVMLLHNYEKNDSFLSQKRQLEELHAGSSPSARSSFDQKKGYFLW